MLRRPSAAAIFCISAQISADVMNPAAATRSVACSAERPGIAAGAGVQEREAADAAGVGQGVFASHEATEGVAHDVHEVVGVAGEPVDDVGQVFGELRGACTRPDPRSGRLVLSSLVEGTTS